jgi:HEAT repeat protein
MRRIALDGRTVLNLSVAEPALIAVLNVEDEELQTRCAAVLAALPTPTAQRAVAHVAMTDDNTVSLRVAAFSALAESAKSNGNLLETGQIDLLVSLARDADDLVIRTAASEALGALNLATNQASEIIRSHHAG